MAQTGHVATLLVPVIKPDVGWETYEGVVSESELHMDTIDLLRAVFLHWAKTSGARVVRNVAIRWLEHDARIGVDPDVAVLLPSPPVEEKALESVRTWLPGHEPPLLAVEIVSKSNPLKDYSIAPAKYAASGTKELWVFDPLLCGPKTFGGPFRLQIYRRDDNGNFARIYAGSGPAHSPALAAWAIATDDGRMLRIADDEAATSFWLTAAEAERANAEAERANAEAERARAEAARARIAELEAELARRG